MSSAVTASLRRGTVFGYSIDANVPLARLHPGNGARGVLELRSVPLSPALEPTEVLARSEDDGWVVGRNTHGLVLTERRSGRYLLEPQAGRIRFAPSGSGAWEHRILTSAIPQLLYERGDLALHASAIVTGAGAVGFCGPSGAGKSTLALALGCAGLPILAEDGLVVTAGNERPQAWPGPLGVRLALQGSAPGEKVTLRRPGVTHRTTPAPLAGLVVLRPRSGTVSESRVLDRFAALPALLPSVLSSDEAGRRRALILLAELVERVPVVVLRAPDDLRMAELAGRLAVERVLERPSLKDPVSV